MKNFLRWSHLYQFQFARTYLRHKKVIFPVFFIPPRGASCMGNWVGISIGVTSNQTIFDVAPSHAVCTWKLKVHTMYKCTLSVLRIFFQSVSFHFSCQKSCNSNFFVKLQHSLLDFCHLTIFFLILDFFMTLNPIFS